MGGRLEDMKFIFIGNRRFVLEEMLALGLDTTVLVVAGTHLHREPLLSQIQHQIIEEKSQLLNIIEDTSFDVLVSNGNPYILPISKMKDATYINIHPSYLPDLKGIDPAHGSMLFGRDGGAACHIMTDEIDAGDIISRIKIPYSDDLDVRLLYQLGFVAEVQVFRNALERNFEPICAQENSSDVIYYSRKEKDKIITFSEGNKLIISKIKAFSNKSQGCSFTHNGESYKVYAASLLSNQYLRDYAQRFSDRTIIFAYEDCMVFKKDGEIIKFDRIEGDISKLLPGAKITD